MTHERSSGLLLTHVHRVTNRRIPILIAKSFGTIPVRRPVQVLTTSKLLLSSCRISRRPACKAANACGDFGASSSVGNHVSCV